MDNRIGSAVFTEFEFPKHNVNYIIEATNQQERVNAINGELRLIKGRIYYLPIDNKEVNSDNCNGIKVFSNLSDKISVLFVKEGYACVTPIIHNFRITNKQHLCNVV